MTPDRAKELQQLLIWGEFAQELNSVIDSETAKLLACDKDELFKIQERIKAFTFIRELPRHLVDRDS